MQALFSACCQIGDEFAKALDSLVSDEDEGRPNFPPSELLANIRGELRFCCCHVRSTATLNRLLQFYSTPDAAEATVSSTTFKTAELLHCFLKINYLHRDSWVIALTGRSIGFEKGDHFWVRVVHTRANPPLWLEASPVSDACHMRLSWECAVLLAASQLPQHDESGNECLVGCSSPSHPLRDDAFTFQGPGSILSACQHNTLFQGSSSWAFVPTPQKLTYESYFENFQRPLLIVIQTSDLDVFGCSFHHSGENLEFITFFTFAPTFRKIELVPTIEKHRMVSTNVMVTKNEFGGLTLCASYNRKLEDEPRILTLDLDADLRWCRAAAKGKATTPQEFHFFVGSTSPSRELESGDCESDKDRIAIEKVEFYCQRNLPVPEVERQTATLETIPIPRSTGPADDDDFVVV